MEGSSKDNYGVGLIESKENIFLSIFELCPKLLKILSKMNV